MNMAGVGMSVGVVTLIVCQVHGCKKHPGFTLKRLHNLFLRLAPAKSLSRCRFCLWIATANVWRCLLLGCRRGQTPVIAAIEARIAEWDPAASSTGSPSRWGGPLQGVTIVAA